MKNKKLISNRLYLRTAINTFFPRILFKLSFKKNWAKKHWAEQDVGEPHGYDNYIFNNSLQQLPKITREVIERSEKTDNILDLGCNCGSQLNMLKNNGFLNLSGVDISKNAIDFGKKHFDFSGVIFYIGSFEDVLPELFLQNKRFDTIYSVGATLELVHPSFDIVKYICGLSKNYVILSISEWGHSYPRFWEYEFNQQGFSLIKRLYLLEGEPVTDPVNQTSLLVFQRVR